MNPKWSPEEQSYAHFSGNPCGWILKRLGFKGPESTTNRIPLRSLTYSDLFDITAVEMIRIGRICGFAPPDKNCDDMSYRKVSYIGPSIFLSEDGKWLLCYAERGKIFKTLASADTIEEIEYFYVQKQINWLRDYIDISLKIKH